MDKVCSCGNACDSGAISWLCDIHQISENFDSVLKKLMTAVQNPQIAGMSEPKLLSQGDSFVTMNYRNRFRNYTGNMLDPGSSESMSHLYKLFSLSDRLKTLVSLNPFHYVMDNSNCTNPESMSSIESHQEQNVTNCLERPLHYTEELDSGSFTSQEGSGKFLDNAALYTRAESRFSPQDWNAAESEHNLGLPLHGKASEPLIMSEMSEVLSVPKLSKWRGVVHQTVGIEDRDDQLFEGRGLAITESQDMLYSSYMPKHQNNMRGIATKCYRISGGQAKMDNTFEPFVENLEKRKPRYKEEEENESKPACTDASVLHENREFSTTDISCATSNQANYQHVVKAHQATQVCKYQLISPKKLMMMRYFQQHRYLLQGSLVAQSFGPVAVNQGTKMGAKQLNSVEFKRFISAPVAKLNNFMLRCRDAWIIPWLGDYRNRLSEQTSCPNVSMDFEMSLPATTEIGVDVCESQYFNRNTSENSHKITQHDGVNNQDCGELKENVIAFCPLEEFPETTVDYDQQKLKEKGLIAGVHIQLQESSIQRSSTNEYDVAEISSTNSLKFHPSHVGSKESTSLIQNMVEKYTFGYNISARTAKNGNKPSSLKTNSWNFRKLKQMQYFSAQNKRLYLYRHFSLGAHSSILLTSILPKKILVENYATSSFNDETKMAMMLQKDISDEDKNGKIAKFLVEGDIPVCNVDITNHSASSLSNDNLEIECEIEFEGQTEGLQLTVQIEKVEVIIGDLSRSLGTEIDTGKRRELQNGNETVNCNSSFQPMLSHKDSTQSSRLLPDLEVMNTNPQLKFHSNVKDDTNLSAAQKTLMNKCGDADAAVSDSKIHGIDKESLITVAFDFG